MQVYYSFQSTPDLTQTGIEEISKAREGRDKELLKERSWLHVDASLGDGKKVKSRKVGVVLNLCLDCVQLRVIGALDKTISSFLAMCSLQEENQSNKSAAEQATNSMYFGRYLHFFGSY